MHDSRAYIKDEHGRYSDVAYFSGRYKSDMAAAKGGDTRGAAAAAAGGGGGGGVGGGAAEGASSIAELEVRNPMRLYTKRGGRGRG